MNEETADREPDFQAACGWWSDLPNVWTPVGWEDHLFRFNIFWDGTVVAQPHLNRRTEAWKDQGVQIACFPLRGGWPGDDGMARQGWTGHAAPVLWTERCWDGILYRQEVFAHVPGGRALERGDEPLFAWVRWSLADTIDALPLERETAFDLSIQAVHVSTSMRLRNNLFVHDDQALYPRPLGVEGRSPGAVRIVESDGRVRLGVARSSRGRVRFTGPHRHDTAAHVKIEAVPVRRGVYVDVLLPMVPADRRVFDRELAMGRDAALREADRFWSASPPTRAAFRVPEPEVESAIRHSVRISRLLAEKNPATGRVCKISGSMTYANLWSTPLAMDMIMLLDTMGEHAYVERHLEIFREEQGTVIPPGDVYASHPGYLSSPALYKSIDWLADNGAILYTLSMHGLLSGNEEYIARFTDTIVRSCDWIRDHRALRGHGGYEGVLPAAVATDACTRIQSVWSDGWNYKGLCAAVRLLKRERHPRAAEFETEARAYRQAYLRALRDKCRSMPAWKDARGRRHVLVPTALSGDRRGETRHAFYLDAGPLFLVFAGLADAADPLMRDTALWFRNGPQRRYYRRDSLCWQVPCLDHEMSSCEPCYSWNVFHSWQLGERHRFLEGMYSLFAGALSRQTFVSCETRGGITGTVFAAPLAVYLARLALVDEQIEPGALHLLRLAPSAWLKEGEETAVDRLPTEFGPVSLSMRLSRDGHRLDVRFTPKFRTGCHPDRIVVHAPPLPGLKTLRFNGVERRAVPFVAGR